MTVLHDAAPDAPPLRYAAHAADARATNLDAADSRAADSRAADTHAVGPHAVITREPASAPAHRWWILGVLGLAQLMVVLDGTIVNIALPRAQIALGFGNGDRQWIVTAYALAFGALLLLGGRLGDLLGRKTTFLIGLGGFALMSAVGGFAQGFGVLVTARAGQGLFAALLAPAALSLLSTTFTDAKERAKAFAIYGAIAGGGGAIGLILGGALTEWLSWRYCLFVNLVIAVPAMLAAAKLLVGGRPTRRPHLDLPGTVTVTAGLFSLVYGFSHAESHGWSDTATLLWLAAGVVVIAAFVVIETRVAHPLLPLRIVLDRDRGGSFLALFISGAGLFAVFLFLTYYLQVSLGYSPIRTGLAFLPMIGALALMAQVAGKLLTRVGPRPVVPAGMALAAAGMLFFTRLSLDSSYVTAILPGLILTGFGLGFIFAPSIQGAVSGIEAEDAGVGSALVSTMQQIGGSIGTALFSTLAATATVDYLKDHSGGAAAAQGALQGYLTVFGWAALLFGVGAVVSLLMLRSGVQQTSDEEPAIADEPTTQQELRPVRTDAAADQPGAEIQRLAGRLEALEAEYDGTLAALRALGMSDLEIGRVLTGLPNRHPGRHVATAAALPVAQPVG